MAISVCAGKGRPVTSPRRDQGPSSDAAAVVVLGIAQLDRIAGGQNSSGSWPTHKNNGTRLSLLEIFLHVHAAMLACGRHEEPDGFVVMDHGAIGAEIEPAFFGIARDRDAGRADESAAVVFMNLGHRKFEHIDLVAGHVYFQKPDRPDGSRRNRF